MKNGSKNLAMDVARSRENSCAATKLPSPKMRRRDHVFTLGIEEEFQIIDPVTRELRSHIQEILADGKIVLKERLKPELHQSQVELGTEICSDAREARLDEMLAFVATEMDQLGNQAEMAHIERIMREGTGADRQLAVWERTQDMKAVVDQIVAETYEGLNMSRPAAIAG